MTVAASLIGIIAVDRIIVRPINRLSETAEAYAASVFKRADSDMYKHKVKMKKSE